MPNRFLPPFPLIKRIFCRNCIVSLVIKAMPRGGKPSWAGCRKVAIKNKDSLPPPLDKILVLIKPSAKKFILHFKINITSLCNYYGLWELILQSCISPREDYILYRLALSLLPTFINLSLLGVKWISVRLLGTYVPILSGFK